MSVNIFGSSAASSAGNVSSGSNNRYVDQKFKTLSANLATKVNKTGDTISGNLDILLNDEGLRTFGVSDIDTGKSVSLLLGNINNQIRHNFDHAIKIAATHGTKFTCEAGEICRLGTQTNSGAQFFNDINMNSHCITNCVILVQRKMQLQKIMLIQDKLKIVLDLYQIYVAMYITKVDLRFQPVMIQIMLHFMFLILGKLMNGYLA